MPASAYVTQGNPVKHEGSEINAKAQPQFSLVALCAGQLLLQLVTDEHPQLLRCWAGHATELDKLAGEALPATSKLHAAIARLWCPSARQYLQCLPVRNSIARLVRLASQLHNALLPAGWRDLACHS